MDKEDKSRSGPVAGCICAGCATGPSVDTEGAIDDARKTAGSLIRQLGVN